MPHVIVKLWPGKSERQKQELAGRIAEDVMCVLGYGAGLPDVGLERHDRRAAGRLMRR